MKVVAGLGNPGPRYAATRHNVGFRVAEALVGAAGARARFHGQFAVVRRGREELGVLRPETFMNLSGRSVQAALTFYKVSPADLLVVHDELDLPFGEVRLKEGGGAAGHNGLRSIIEAIGSGFGRLRIGIGRPPAGTQGRDHVLEAFAPEEGAALQAVLDRAVAAVDLWADQGISAAMNVVNRRT